MLQWAAFFLLSGDNACDRHAPGLSPAACCRNHPTHFWNQYCVLQRRALQAYTRNPLNVAGRTMMAIFIGILGGLVFMKEVPGEHFPTSMIYTCA